MVRMFICSQIKGLKKWFEIGSKQGWNCNHILEDSIEALGGADVIDFIETPLWLDIETAINGISKDETTLSQKSA